MGCKGPVTFQNCPNVRWNDGTSWPIGCGHPCIGCAEPDFWDKMTPFYAHLSGVPGFGVASSVDKVGLWATVGVGAAFAAHGFMSLGKRWWNAEHHPAAREKAEEAQRRAEDDKKGGQP
jgi:hydrogenase small subunit